MNSLLIFIASSALDRITDGASSLVAALFSSILLLCSLLSAVFGLLFSLDLADFTEEDLLLASSELAELDLLWSFFCDEFEYGKPTHYYL